MSQVVGLPNNSYKPITNTAWVRARLCKLQKGCTRLAAASNKVYQLLAHGRWFSLGTPASSTTKTGRHDIAEILLKVALNTTNQIKSNIGFYIVKKIFELTNCGNKSNSLRELPLLNLQIFLLRVWFKKYTKQCRFVQ